jgi:WD40 repeat protein
MLYSLDNFNNPIRLPFEGGNNLDHISFNDSGNKIVSAIRSQLRRNSSISIYFAKLSMLIYDIETNKHYYKHMNTTSQAGAHGGKKAAFSHGTNLVAVSDYEQIVYVARVDKILEDKEGEPVFSTLDENTFLYSHGLSWAPNDELLAHVYYEHKKGSPVTGIISIWKLDGKGWKLNPRHLKNIKFEVQKDENIFSDIGLAFSPDSRLIAVGGDTDIEMVKLFDIESGKLLCKSPNIPSRIPKIQFTPDGKYMITGGKDGILRIWEVQDMNNSYALSILISYDFKGEILDFDLSKSYHELILAYIQGKEIVITDIKIPYGFN